MNQQQSPVIDWQKAANIGIDLLFYAVTPLHLVSRRLVGASQWGWGILVGPVLLLLFTELRNGHSTKWPWIYCWIGQYLYLTHLGAYLWSYRKGKAIHKDDIGRPWFGTLMQCDLVCALALSGIFYGLGDTGFAQWWLFNIALTCCYHLYFWAREAARDRAIKSWQMENEYWGKFTKKDSGNE